MPGAGLARVAAVLGWLTFVTLTLSLVGIFLYAPRERVQGDVQRIFYFHVPLAWVAYLAFFVVFLGGLMYLWKRDERWDRWARCSAELGVLFTTLVLATGSIWGKPIWGTWWTWDARLTSTFILWFLYLGYLMLRAYVPDREQGARFGAVLGLVAFLDVPIVQMSVVWWRTLHPGPTIIQESGAAGMPPEMLLVFGVSLVAFTLLYGALLVQRVRLEELRDAVARWEGAHRGGGAG
ncbi:MAG: cytochrome c biogenesis protein CcsA [Chloroflexi bacterium]|nr:cytochrome c biogenesis protein CcsA [Chloroflexota bacterium]